MAAFNVAALYVSTPWAVVLIGLGWIAGSIAIALAWAMGAPEQKRRRGAR